MNNSKEKEHRISNLKEMMDNIKETEENSSYDDIEEDKELIEYLNEDSVNFEEMEINDEFIYHPDDDDNDAINLEENPIDEDFIIKTPNINEIEEELDEFNEDFVGEISENFDIVINAKIGGKPILGIISSIIGVILIILSIFIFNSRSDRVIDNVVAGETSFMFIIFLAIGTLLLLYGIYKVFNVKNPLKNMSDNINSIEINNKNKKNTKKSKEEKASPKVVPKSKIPIDKESYKIGEFNIDDLKKSHKKNTDSEIKETEEKGLITKEIEKIEHDQEVIDNESIDDIFAEVEDIEEIPIISIDSEEDK